jgi:phosphoribosylformimino-5-aminoimidazole carboxamide ribonucleotide (ProFAR) isomerase
MGAGEILLTSIDREGTWDGFDLDLVKRVTDAVSIPGHRPWRSRNGRTYRLKW